MLHNSFFFFLVTHAPNSLTQPLRPLLLRIEHATLDMHFLQVGVEIGQAACQGPVAWPVFGLIWPVLFKKRIRLRPILKSIFLTRPGPDSI